ncbi:MAG: F0F1 ATP synthase subunit delta, partial [Actinomycetales bacterium]
MSTTQLRGASAASLDTVLAAVDASGDSGAELGDQLFGVVAALDSSPALRRVLTDPSTEDEAKRGLASSVFGEAVSAATIEVVRTAVGSRWRVG